MNDAPVRVSIHVPSVASGALPSGAEYAEFFRAVEDAGLDGVWVEDRIFHRSNMLDGFSLLHWAAANTNRIRLGTAVALLNIRNVAVLARMTSSLQHLSNGRLALGLSLGGRPNEYAAVGQAMKRRPSAFEMNLQLLRQLLRGEPVNGRNGSLVLEDALVRPAADIPIYIGGRSEAALGRAGTLADGWIMGPFEDFDAFTDEWRKVRDAATSAGRDQDGLHLGRLIYISVDDDRDRAKATAEAFLHSYYEPGTDIDRICVYGVPAAVAAELRRYVDAGLREFMLGVPSLDRAHLERIANEVAPVLRG